MSAHIIESARRWYSANAQAHLSADRMVMIDRCARYLCAHGNLSLRAATGFAIDAWAADHRPASGWRVCQTHSTTDVIVLRHDDGRRLVLAIDDIAPPDAPPRWLGVDLAANAT